MQGLNYCLKFENETWSFNLDFSKMKVATVLFSIQLVFCLFLHIDTSKGKLNSTKNILHELNIKC